MELMAAVAGRYRGAQGAAVGADLALYLDHDRIVRQPLIHRRQGAGRDPLGEHGRFVVAAGGDAGRGG